MLSGAKIKRAQPGEKDYKIADEKGLYLLVTARSTKLWRHKYRVAGKERTGSYGAYPEVSLKQARDRRDETRALLREGKDPSIEQRKARTLDVSDTEHTFETLALEWWELNKARWAQRHAADVLRSLERDIFPMLGTFPPAEITAPLILACVRAVEQRGAIETAGRARQRISGVLAYGLSMGIVPSNPAEQVKGAGTSRTIMASAVALRRS